MLPNIALYGRSGCGKSTVAAYLSQKYGYTRSSSGAACRKVCQELFHSESKTLLNRVTDAMKAIDENVWLYAALSGIPLEQLIVFDSMRFQNDYEYLQSKGFCFWKMTASPEVRISRLRERGQEFDASVDEFHNSEKGLENYQFDYHIVNDSSDFAVLYHEIDRIISLIIHNNSFR